MLQFIFFYDSNREEKIWNKRDKEKKDEYKQYCWTVHLHRGAHQTKPYPLENNPSTTAYPEKGFKVFRD